MKNKIRLVVVTFIEGGFAVWALTGFSLDVDPKIALGGGIAAAASLIYNLLRDVKRQVTPALDTDAMGFNGAEGVPSSEEEETK
jgi:hypothetical protein